MKRGKKISYQNLPATRLAQSNPTTQQIGAIQATHPPNQCPSSLPPPDQLKTWPQPLDRHNLKGSMALATKSTSSTTRSVLPSHHQRPLPQLEPPSHKSKLCHHYSAKPNHRELESSDHHDSRLQWPPQLRAPMTTFVSKRGDGWGVGMSQHVQKGAGGVRVSQFVECFTKFF